MTKTQEARARRWREMGFTHAKIAEMVAAPLGEVRALLSAARCDRCESRESCAADRTSAEQLTMRWVRQEWEQADAKTRRALEGCFPEQVSRVKSREKRGNSLEIVGEK